jgi:hypothetical protein
MSKAGKYANDICSHLYLPALLFALDHRKNQSGWRGCIDVGLHLLRLSRCNSGVLAAKRVSLECIVIVRST